MSEDYRATNSGSTQPGEKEATAEEETKRAMHFELLASCKAKITNLVNFGDTPLGYRLDVHFEGDLIGDLLSGRINGIDYLITRPDGVSEMNVRAWFALMTDPT